MGRGVSGRGQPVWAKAQGQDSVECRGCEQSYVPWKVGSSEDV